ncbi:Na(+)/H(+) antiporter subunit D [Rubripirellula obstinata]|uniref:Na(+)/H(+) antiporter subunit D n=1 Tax=Rubripirellula obstinata TaxID=406547 RepID=A0A5B1CNR7_9BACT|nr:proton-conducting transporter membrane subunit [Rubripirellula obstinata]KAA1262002.1 Na(+)/H(+) antiporter subunit D [Rubripirellula obstinata]
MSLEAVFLGLIVLPLLGGCLAFLSRPLALPANLVVAVGQLICAFELARTVMAQGPLSYKVGGWDAPLGVNLYADGLTAMMLVMVAVVGGTIVLYTAGAMRSIKDDTYDQQLFWPINLLLLASLNALFLSGDIFNLYVTLELLTLSAVALIGLVGTVDALTAALRYLLVAISASLLYLLGVALLYSIYGTVDWHLLGDQIQVDQVKGDQASLLAIALIVSGLLLKTAVFPLHFWLPPAHSSAPTAASALLSALVLKASFYIILRLWFSVFPYAEFQNAGTLLTTLGVAAILWGSLQAINQTQLKAMVAYSTVAQVGYLFLVFSLASDAAVAWDAWSATVLFAVSHAVGKAAVFLAAGSLQYATGSKQIDSLAGIAREQPVTVLAFATAGVVLIGLPPSGAFVAKWLLLQSAIASGQWPLAAVILTGGVLAAIYVFRVLSLSLLRCEPRESCEPRETRPVPRLMQYATLGLAIVAITLGMMASPMMELLKVDAPFSANPFSADPVSVSTFREVAP